jgi:hypothetical protein
LRFGRFEERAAIERARERIRRGEAPQLIFRTSALGRVA